MIYTISDEKYTISVSDIGAELTSAVCDGFNVMWAGKEFWLKHAPLLFPICGRLKDKTYTVGGKEYHMDIHGFISARKFELVNRTATKLTLKNTSDEETRKLYPFDYTFIAEYELLDGKVLCKTKVTNDSALTMPFMFGWHHAFAYPDTVNVLEDFTFDFGDRQEFTNHPGASLSNTCEKAKLVPQKVLLPYGKYKLDTETLYDTDTIVLSNMGTKVTMTDGKEYTLKLSWSENLKYLCMWKKPDNAARYLCIEPWSNSARGVENAENFDLRDMIRLEPGKSEEFFYEFELVK
ncbi:MAG: hypothetical protein IJW38_05620 [Clostridia bacterium]|nr:hypothetical protein [Clostridia bacterium]